VQTIRDALAALFPPELLAAQPAASAQPDAGAPRIADDSTA